MIYRFPSTPHQLHEQRIEEAMSLFLARKVPWSEVQTLIAHRSPEQIRRMEEERGL